MSKKTRVSAPPRTAPPIAEALAALTRRTLRAWVALFLRLLGVALLTTVLAFQIPWVAANKGLIDALSGVLVLWPFFTAIGRNLAWRIALGRAYAREARWAEAEQALALFARPHNQVFDATGEAAYWLALALREQGRTEAARRQFTTLAHSRRGEWAEKAAAELASETV